MASSSDAVERQSSADRRAVLTAVVSAIPRPEDHRRNVFVGIDGVDGSGKTMFADDIAELLAPRHPAVRISIDGFHRRRTERYRRGRHSPEGFFLDSYDYAAFDRHVIAPLQAGPGPYLTASHDLDSDELLDAPAHHLTAPSVIVVDGIFLHRRELRAVWDFSVFLRVDFAVSAARMARRDGSDPDPEAASNRRYIEGQRIYLREDAPERHAAVIVENDDLEAPRIVGSGQ
ncbi:uridine kinase [Microbacterium sp. K36]|uniref:uridine kinase n=1 Tax=Microbacterium sp. K36 TaxID=2305439 RepID=UPI00109C3ED2|nr:uridine kinase [Microbacterium sp. K36]